MYERAHNGSRVCTKRIRSHTSEDPKKAARVSFFLFAISNSDGTHRPSVKRP